MTGEFNSTHGVPRALVWLRRDLRLDDNVAIATGCSMAERVLLAFVVDPVLLANPRMGAPLVGSFFSALAALRDDLRSRGSDLAILLGEPAECLLGLARRIGARAIVYNADNEPDAMLRDARADERFAQAGLLVRRCADLTYFAPLEISTGESKPYKVFTPYKRRWLEQHAVAPRLPIPSARMLAERLVAGTEIGATGDVPLPSDYGFAASPLYPRASEAIAGRALDGFLERSIGGYAQARDFPAIAGTSQLSPQLRAGTIGIRSCVTRAFARLKHAGAAERTGVQTWISELIWRDFYQMILARFPHVASGPFLPAAARIAWSDDRQAFAAWCEGRTGYPIVDAAMRQLNTHGWMHNRLRMIAASFLAKDLLIDWRWGELYFEQHLADADVAANNGGWQWAASTGTDAVPYFRIFNPTLQQQKFDPDGAFVAAMVPELGTAQYPAPIVDHATARVRALAAYEAVFGKSARPA